MDYLQYWKLYSENEENIYVLNLVINGLPSIQQSQYKYDDVVEF